MRSVGARDAASRRSPGRASGTGSPSGLPVLGVESYGASVGGRRAPCARRERTRLRHRRRGVAQARSPASKVDQPGNVIRRPTTSAVVPDAVEIERRRADGRRRRSPARARSRASDEAHPRRADSDRRRAASSAKARPELRIAVDQRQRARGELPARRDLRLLARVAPLRQREDRERGRQRKARPARRMRGSRAGGGVAATPRARGQPRVPRRDGSSTRARRRRARRGRSPSGRPRRCAGCGGSRASPRPAGSPPRDAPANSARSDASCAIFVPDGVTRWSKRRAAISRCSGVSASIARSR